MAIKPKSIVKPLVTKAELSLEEVALLQRCFETPWDDAPILIYSDWVQENGEDKRAEFIRAGVRTGKRQIKWPISVKEWVNRVLPDGSWQFFRGLPVRIVEDECSRLARHDPPVDEAEERLMMWSDRKTVQDINKALKEIPDDGWPLCLSVFQQRHACLPFCGWCINKLVNLPIMARVGVLRIEVNEMSSNDAKALTQSKMLKNLWWLRWPDANPPSRHARELIAALKHLRVIDWKTDDDEEREYWIEYWRD